MDGLSWIGKYVHRFGPGFLLIFFGYSKGKLFHCLRPAI